MRRWPDILPLWKPPCGIGSKRSFWRFPATATGAWPRRCIERNGGEPQAHPADLARGIVALPTPAELGPDERLAPQPERYPNLAKGRAITGLNQLWVADITGVHLPRAVVYPAAVLDAFS